MGILSFKTRSLKYVFRRLAVVSRSTSQSKGSSNWWRRLKNHLRNALHPLCRSDRRCGAFLPWGERCQYRSQDQIGAGAREGINEGQIVSTIDSLGYTVSRPSSSLS
jgi:hypothetical protein